MKQIILYQSHITRETSLHTKPVNVASVPQRSPFRYPGGKTWFVPTFRKWMASKTKKPKFLIEPFAGGGIISLTAIFENLVDKVIMVEKDEEISAVWQAVVEGHANWLAKRILEFDLTKKKVIIEIKKKYIDPKKKAFQTILKNRTFHGGILAEGSGFLKYGENGKGILSRWYPNTIAKRFQSIGMVASRIEFIFGDGFEVLRAYKNRSNAVYFIDPPYTAGGKKAGRRLYRHYEIDHEKLFSICESLKSDFIMTYDNIDEVKEMASKYSFEVKPIAMKTTHHSEMAELVIGRDLSWMNPTPKSKKITRQK